MYTRPWRLAVLALVLIVAWSMFAAWQLGWPALKANVIVAVWQLSAAWLIVKLVVDQRRHEQVYREYGWKARFAEEAELIVKSMLRALEAGEDATRAQLEKCLPRIQEQTLAIRQLQDSGADLLGESGRRQVAEYRAALEQLEAIRSETDPGVFMHTVIMECSGVYAGGVLSQRALGSSVRGEQSIFTRLGGLRERWSHAAISERMDRDKRL